MGYNLLKSLHIKVGKEEILIDCKKYAGLFCVVKDKNGCFNLDIAEVNFTDFAYIRNLNSYLVENHFSKTKLTSISYTINSSIEGTADYNTITTFLSSFDNVIKTKGDRYYLYPVDSFSMRLSEELYSVETQITDIRCISPKCICPNVCDFGVTTDVPGATFSPIKIVALRLLNGERLVYEDNSKFYEIVLTKNGKGLIVKYKTMNNAISIFS